MSWLLELLVDAIREMCSQFIVDMMELITNMFTELLSCNLSLFEELFSVVGSLYKNVIVPTGIAILLMILVWQLFKSMFGGKAGVNAEEPIELICRSAISLFLLAGSKPLVDYILRIAGTPYQWVVGTKVKVASFSGYVSTLEGVTDTLGVSSLSISVLMLIMQFVVAWNYFKMLMVIAERYVLLGVFSYTAPLAFATGGSKATNNILASWSKMFGGQVVLVILNAWCMKMFLSGYGNMMASELIAAMYSLRFPRSITITFAMVLRFFPTFSEEIHRIYDAMKLRGIALSWKNVFTRPLLLLEAMVVPIVMRSASIADELSASAVTRGIDNPDQRTSFVQLKVTPKDIIVLVSFVIAFVALFYAKYQIYGRI